MRKTAIAAAAFVLGCALTGAAGAEPQRREWPVWSGTLPAGVSPYSCNGADARGLDVRLSVRCRTGWVADEWVTIISG